MLIRDRLRTVLAVKDNPHHTALSFSLGVFIGMSPLLGIHTILGLLFAAIFRLNKLVTIMGVYVTNPWTIIPIYTFCTWIGMKLLRLEGIIDKIQWKSLSFFTITEGLKGLLLPFVVGTLFVGMMSSLISYGIIFVLVRRRGG